MIPAHFPASISGSQAFSCKFLRSGCHGYATQLKGSNESAVERKAHGFQSHTFLCFALIENMQSALPMEAKPSGTQQFEHKGKVDMVEPAWSITCGWSLCRSKCAVSMRHYIAHALASTSCKALEANDLCFEARHSNLVCPKMFKVQGSAGSTMWPDQSSRAATRCHLRPWLHQCQRAEVCHRRKRHHAMVAVRRRSVGHDSSFDTACQTKAVQ